MAFDPENPVIALCAAGMAAEGVPAEARMKFEEAWAARRDDYDSAIAAHYLARHQAAPSATLHWNALAVTHFERIPDERARELGASLYLNLADSLLATGHKEDARVAIGRAAFHVESLPPDGYRQMIEGAIARLLARISASEDPIAAT